MKKKKCSKCKREQPAEEFHNCESATDGLSSWCKGCRRVSQAKPEERNKRRSEWADWTMRSLGLDDTDY